MQAECRPDVDAPNQVLEQFPALDSSLHADWPTRRRAAGKSNFFSQVRGPFVRRGVCRKESVPIGGITTIRSSPWSGTVLLQSEWEKRTARMSDNLERRVFPFTL